MYNKTVYRSNYEGKEKFIEEARKIHGDKYDYSKVEYKNIDTKVCIICPKHGEFLQTPYKHIKNKQNCPKCKGKVTTLEEFIEESKNIHGEIYDYSKVEFINATKKVCIICKTHGEFYMTPNSHLSGQGCPKCATELRKHKLSMSNDTFIEKLTKISDRFLESTI